MATSFKYPSRGELLLNTYYLPSGGVYRPNKWEAFDLMGVAARTRFSEVARESLISNELKNNKSLSKIRPSNPWLGFNPILYYRGNPTLTTGSCHR